MTDDVIDQEQTEENASQLSGPGRHLREAREARKLTVAEVAAELRMQTRIIEALENDDFSAIPGTTFIQGYLRSYSRLLGLPEENILALLPDVDEESTLVGTIAKGPAEVTSRDLPVRMISIIILIIMVVGFGWWLSQREPSVIPDSPELALPDSDQSLALPMDTVPLDSGNEASVEAVEITPAEEQLPENVPDKGTDEVAETVPGEEVVKTVGSLQPAEKVETPVQLTADIPQSQLVVEYQADSWSEITDAAGRKLAYDLKTSGTELRLNGEAPFRIFLGYAPGVTIYFNGTKYDHSAYHSGDIARFRIGSAEDNQPGSR